MVLDPTLAACLASGVLALHVAIAAFVIVGLAFAIVGNLRRWRWVNNLCFRVTHLAAIGVVVAEAWFGVVCPLTSLEMWLRSQAGARTYAGGFIEHWLERILYLDAAPWVFVLAYSVFGGLVLAVWWIYPPRRERRVVDPVA